VSIERRLFQTPERTTIAMWITVNPRKEKAKMKWIVRADCRPPSRGSWHRDVEHSEAGENHDGPE
jgi:hypothetical protein